MPQFLKYPNNRLIVTYTRKASQIMKDEAKTKEQLLHEVIALRQRVTELEALEMEREQTEARLQQYAGRLQGLHELDRAITTSLRLNDIYHAFVRHTVRLLPYDYIAIMLLEEGVMRPAYLTGESSPSLPGDPPSFLPSSAASWVVERRQPLLRHNVAAIGGFAEDERLVAQGVRSDMILPLRIKGQVIGTWYLGSQQVGAYGPDELEMAQLMADQLAPVIENARLYKQTQQEIIERKRAEEALRASEKQLYQAQKMEALGQLTGGIAHDFNNLLTAIIGFSELMRLQLLPEDPLQELMDKVIGSSQRAADLVRQLLTFSRKQIIEPKVLDLNAIMTEMDGMLQRIIGEDIELKTLLQPELWPVKVDPAQIEQVIVNLVVNARDAMPEGGRLIIETSNMMLEENDIARHLGVQPGGYVLLAVSDTGIGMTEEIKARIFEPFFTTKSEDKGTGLGLATVYGIVKQSGGDIWVYSEPGQGTTFKIYLPRAEKATQLLNRSETRTDMPKGSETILLVEDDPGVRELARLVLHGQGYSLLEAVDPQEAFLLFSSYSDPIHLVVTDVIMPGRNGKSLVGQLVQARPNLKVLFMSGYTDNVIAQHGVLDPTTAFLQKPFSAGALARKVREVLDQKS